MKQLVAMLSFCVCLAACLQARSTTLPDACGNDKIKFEVKTEKNQPPPAPPADGKAQLVFVETVEKENLAFCAGCEVVARLGFDGAWVGANKGNSYFTFTVEPGEHHICTNWESDLGSLDKKVGVAAFTAEPGKVYYYQVKILMRMVDIDTAQMEQRLDLIPISEDEGKYLIKISPLATSSPKK